ncbi:hypothetical protein G4B88_015924 [Cannabis sativa]|uniref:Spen paralogue and orthologue SPOC C-terminal domain-containing protein n=1 Tax=Cannabis sativa TaxID=3483 RepID=A0A7J6ELD3_CANSA|nr:hypothetical protein G4B88_015924 [Cannabis sativa]
MAASKKSLCLHNPPVGIFPFKGWHLEFTEPLIVSMMGIVIISFHWGIHCYWISATVEDAGSTRTLFLRRISSVGSAEDFSHIGEKTSVNKWPGLLQIKGRVRLDAFEKFLQEVPLSRTRAVMVVHFVLKDQSSENESTALREVADSYILDDRVGFSEPVAGVELYFCPPHYKTVNILGKIIQKEHMDALNAIDNGLIGVIVWRKLSTISPKSSSQKHILKKQHMTSRMLQDSAPKSNLIAKQALPRDLVATNSKSSSTDHEDDIPPGFGPPASKGEEDDLPEFNFSSGLNPPTRNNFTRDLSRGSVPIHHPASRPVEQVRELIHKYGQNNTSTIPPGNWKYKGVRGFGGQPWNDDDDFPEWQPHVPTQQARNLQQQMLTPHMLNQAHFGLACQQPIHQAMQPTLNGPENMASWQNQQQHGTWRVPPVQGNGLLPCNLGCQLSVWQMYGASGHGIFGQPGIDCEQNTPPKSRGV